MNIKELEKELHEFLKNSIPDDWTDMKLYIEYINGESKYFFYFKS